MAPLAVIIKKRGIGSIEHSTLPKFVDSGTCHMKEKQKYITFNATNASILFSTAVNLNCNK